MDERAETGQDFIVVSCILFWTWYFCSAWPPSQNTIPSVSVKYFFSFSRTNVCLFLQLLSCRNRYPSVPREHQREPQGCQDDRAPHRHGWGGGGGGERTGPGLTGITGDAREPFCALRYTPAFLEGWKEDFIWNGTKRNYKVCCDRLISGTTKPRVASRIKSVERVDPGFRFLIIVFVHDCSHHVVLWLQPDWLSCMHMFISASCFWAQFIWKDLEM